MFTKASRIFENGVLFCFLHIKSKFLCNFAWKVKIFAEMATHEHQNESLFLHIPTEDAKSSIDMKGNANL